MKMEKKNRVYYNIFQTSNKHNTSMKGKHSDVNGGFNKANKIKCMKKNFHKICSTNKVQLFLFLWAVNTVKGSHIFCYYFRIKKWKNGEKGS